MNFFEDGARLIQIAVFLVKIGEVSKNIRITRRGLGQSFVGFDGFWILFQNFGVGGPDEIFFLTVGALSLSSTALSEVVCA